MVLLPVDDRRCSCSREEAVHRVTVVKEEAVVAAEEAEAVVEVVVSHVLAFVWSSLTRDRWRWYNTLSLMLLRS